jgi:hypothetical protein
MGSLRAMEADMKHTLTGIGTVALTGLLVAGCGGSSGTATSQQHASASAKGGPGSPSAGATSAASQPKGGLPDHGLVLLVCGGVGEDTMTLVAIDPATQKVQTQLTVPISIEDKTYGHVSLSPSGICGAPQSPWRVREHFDPGFAKVAVSLGEQPDGSKHVGWYDISTGSVVDVTARDVGHNFSSPVPHDIQPVFDSVTGELWFSRDGHVRSLDPATMRETDHHQAPGGIGTDLGALSMGVLGGHLITPDDMVPDATGRRAARVIEGGGATKVRVVDASRGITDDAAPGEDHAYPGPWSTCAVEAWRDDTHVIVGSAFGDRCPFSTLDVSRPAARPQPILPAVTSDRTNRDFVPAPDGASFALLSVGAADFTVYTSNGSPTTEPTPVYTSKTPDLKQATLLCWR